MDAAVKQKIESITEKARHFLMMRFGRFVQEATAEELYMALSYSMREEVITNWLATAKTFSEHDVKIMYYLSMEYLPGKIFYHNNLNLQSQETVQMIIKGLGKSPSELLLQEREPALGNGGLGRLASCLMDSLATLQFPAQGYGLRYQYGIFEQQIWDTFQVEIPETWLLTEFPWEFRRDTRKVIVNFSGDIIGARNKCGEEIFDLKNSEEVAAIPYDLPIIGHSPEPVFNVLTLRLWSTKESPRNFHLQRFNAGRLDQAAENITLTDVLYPSEHHETGIRIRLKQEFLLVSASLQDIIQHFLQAHKDLELLSEKVAIQINDTHPALVVAELIRILLTDFNFTWKRAVEVTEKIVSYTNHTVLQEALEQWDRELFFTLFPVQYKIIDRLNHDLCYSIRKRYPNQEEKVRRMSIIENNKIRMANLAIVGSNRVNGVSALHTEILKNKLFRDFHEFYPNKFLNVTNGISPRRWLHQCNPLLEEFITKRIGNTWLDDLEQIQRLKEFSEDPESQSELMLIKRKNKERLAGYLSEVLILKDENGNNKNVIPKINIDSLFDVQIKRIHEYKRQLLNIINVIMIYLEILDNPYHKKIPRTVLFAGKAPAQYEAAKAIVCLINCVSRKLMNTPKVNEILQVVYVENYNVTRAEKIIPAADLSEQISTAGMEASGTGNMKLSLNGALTIATEDGANIEMRESVGDNFWPFRFGSLSAELEELKKHGGYNPKDFLHDSKVTAALDTLCDHTFAEKKEEHETLCRIKSLLVDEDRYFVLKDLPSYHESQKHVEELYQNPSEWARFAMHNIAGMGIFSSDRVVKNYAEKIWNITPCPIDQNIFEKVKQDFGI